MPQDQSNEDDGSLSAQGILDKLNEATETDEPEDKIELEDTEDKEEDEPDEEEEPEGKTEDKEDEEEDKSEDEDKDDDDEEELSLVAPFRKRDILKKYPKIFKEFPYLEEAFYRDQKFVEVFPTVRDAKEAAEKAEYMERFEAQLMDGDTETVLKLVRDNDQNSFNEIVDNYIEVLGKVDPNAQLHVIGNVAKNLIITLAREGKSRKDENLQNTAQILQEFLFQTKEFEAPKKLAKERSEDDNSERDEWREERFNTVQGDMSKRIENSLTATINSSIDPRDSMTEYVKSRAVKDVLSQMQEQIGDDNRFTKILDGLWIRANEQNYSEDSMRKIRGAYLSKAKTVLPRVIRKVRQEALKGLGRKSSSGGKTKERGRTTSSTTRTKSSERSKDGKGMSTVDFFNQD